jgi:hypothetical protein
LESWNLWHIFAEQINQNSLTMQHTANTPKREAMASLFTEVNTLGTLITCSAEWDALTCEEQMLVEQAIED